MDCEEKLVRQAEMTKAADNTTKVRPLGFLMKNDDLPRQARDNRFRDSKTKGMAVFAFHVNAFAFHVNVSG